MRNVCRTLTISIFAALLAAGTLTFADADARSISYDLNIPSEDLTAALQSFAIASHHKLLYKAELTAGKISRELKGHFTAQEAMEALLSGTGLSYEITGSSVVLIKSLGDAKTSDLSVDGMPRPASGALSQVSGGHSIELEQATPATTQSNPAYPQNTIVPDSTSKNVDRTDLAEIVVTGTHIAGTKVAAPTITMDRAQIEDAGYSTLEEAFQSLPQNLADLTPMGRQANEGGSLLDARNNMRVTGVDLRGLGPESTLTLLNGTRVAGGVDGRVVDLSEIPLSIIQGVDVVTGGNSAIYGADAVAGVVNMTTRQDFNGFESDVYLGAADKGGGQRLNVSQTAGIVTDKGGFVAVLDYARDLKFDLVDVGLLNTQFIPQLGASNLNFYAQAPTTRQSAYLAGHFQPTDGIELYATGLYTSKKYNEIQNFNFGDPQNSDSAFRDRSEFYTVSAGAKLRLAGDWTLDVSGATSAHSDTFDESDVLMFPGFPFSDEIQDRARATLSSISAIAKGSLFEIAGITPKSALGVEWRHEGVEDDSATTGDFTNVTTFSRDRSVRSAFAELALPLIGNGGPGARRLEISVAGRYDHYSDFGGTFNPQAGIIWQPTTDLTLRGSWASAFRAPSLAEFNESADDYLQLAADPTRGGSNVPVLFENGFVPNLGPEKAKTWTAGFDFNPTFAHWLKTSFSFFDVSYDDRIEIPAAFSDRPLVLTQVSEFPSLINRNPTASEVAAILAGAAQLTNETGIPFNPASQSALAVFPNLVVFDDRETNLASEQMRAIDGSLQTTFEQAIGTLNFGINATDTLHHTRFVTPTSTAIQLRNLVEQPVAFRFRATAGWTRSAFSAFAYVNYIGSYTDQFATPPSPMASWTTVDTTLRFNGSKLNTGGKLDGFSATLSVSNLFDARPPRFNESLTGNLFDPINASPFGRYISLRLVEKW